jgi:hypothetical protein
MKNSKLLVLIAALVVAGCAEMSGMGQAQGPGPAPVRATTMKMKNVACPGAQCDVTVTVTRLSSPPGCAVSVPDKVNVAANAGGNTQIKWRIYDDDGKFHFRSQNAIVFKDPPPGHVMPPSANGGGVVVVINDKHRDASTAGAWEYAVYVDDGAVSCGIDPWIDNN